MSNDVQKMTALLEAHELEHPTPCVGCQICRAVALHNAYAFAVERLCEAERVRDNTAARKWGWIVEQLDPQVRNHGFVVSQHGLWLRYEHMPDATQFEQWVQTINNSHRLIVEM